jgi:hypothetical protein
LTLLLKLLESRRVEEINMQHNIKSSIFLIHGPFGSGVLEGRGGEVR